MATGETETTPKTTLELLCNESGVPYTQELQDYEANLVRLQQLGQLADLARFVDEHPLPRIEYSQSITSATTPEIEQSIATSYSIACEHHPQRNEDNSFILNTPGKIIAGGVFDGLGGYSGSERASKIAAETVNNSYLAGGSEFMTPDEAAAYATDILTRTEAKIGEDYALIATTAAMASIHTNPETNERFANIAWAGDSRVYVIRNGQIIYRTLDDGIAGSSELFDEIYPDEPDPSYRAQAFLESCQDTYDLPWELQRAFHERNIVANCLGGRDEAVVHTHTIGVEHGDIILASSDGVHDNLTNKEILAILHAGGGVKELTEAALTRSRDKDHVRHKPDDITAVLINV